MSEYIIRHKGDKLLGQGIVKSVKEAEDVISRRWGSKDCGAYRIYKVETIETEVPRKIPCTFGEAIVHMESGGICILTGLSYKLISGFLYYRGCGDINWAPSKNPIDQMIRQNWYKENI